MDEMIIEELLSEVLGVNIKRVINLSSPNKVYYDGELGTDVINIYELAHKCKEWAFDKMFFLSSGFDTDGAFCLDRMNNKSFIAETEPEAIFKACQWVLEKKERK